MSLKGAEGCKSQNWRVRSVSNEKKKLCTGTEQQIIKIACVKRCNIQWGMNWTLLAHIMKDCVLNMDAIFHTYINNYGVKKGFERQRNTKISYSDSHTLGHYRIKCK